VIALALNSAEQDDRSDDAREPPPAAASPPRQVAASAATSAGTAPNDGNTGSNELSLEAPGIVPGVSIGVVGDAGSLPETALGVAFGVELGTQRWQLRALGTLLLDQHHQLGSSGPAPGAELGLATGALSACTLSVSSLPPLEVLGCAGWELGQLSGAGRGVPNPRQGTKLWSAPLLGGGARWHVPGTAFRLGATVDLAAPLGRDEFVLRGVGRVHRPGSIVGRVVLGAALTLD
jgi:hypothetical protein